jgi:predicted nuclease of predicted toxin-antitoxin system
MQVWIDAQLSPALALWLRDELGLDAHAARDLGLLAAEDAAIFQRAREAEAAVMTKDRDFLDLLDRHGPPPQVIWLTCGNTTTAYLKQLLSRVWREADEMLAAGEPLIEIGGRPT